MALEHSEFLPAQGRRAVSMRGCWSGPLDANHIVVCTQELARMAAVVHQLTAAGYIVTAYSSPSRLLPRLHKLAPAIGMLLIDGSADVPFARSALIRTRAAFADLPIVLLSHAETDIGLEAMRLGASQVLYMPLQGPELVAAIRSALKPAAGALHIA